MTENLRNTFNSDDAVTLSISATDTYGINRLNTQLFAELEENEDIQNTFTAGIDDIQNTF